MCSDPRVAKLPHPENLNKIIRVSYVSDCKIAGFSITGRAATPPSELLRIYSRTLISGRERNTRYAPAYRIMR
jgi:hypothetical protein